MEIMSHINNAAACSVSLQPGDPHTRRGFGLQSFTGSFSHAFNIFQHIRCLRLGGQTPGRHQNSLSLQRRDAKVQPDLPETNMNHRPAHITHAMHHRHIVPAYMLPNMCRYDKSVSRDHNYRCMIWIITNN